MWRLLSYSDVKLPLDPYRNYVIGIAENDNKERRMVHLEEGYLEDISVGISGRVEVRDGPKGKINIFIPDVEKSEKPARKVALITGSSVGIGKEIALELARNGIDIAINSDKTKKEGLEIVKEIQKMGREAIYVKADVSNLDQVIGMFDKVIEKFGRIDILVNNAGVTDDKRVENMTEEQWDRVISVNLKGVFNCTKTVVSYMQKQGSGKIVNISSVVAEMGNIGQSNYAASKGGIISFSKTVAREYANDNILVNVVAPGFIKTRMVEKIPQGILQNIVKQIPLGRMGKAGEVAKLVNFLVSDDANYITGQVFKINGGLYM